MGTSPQGETAAKGQIRVFPPGIRFEGPDPAALLSARRKILVVDDSVHCGASIRAVRETISAANLPHEVFYGAVYITPIRNGLLIFSKKSSRSSGFSNGI